MEIRKTTLQKYLHNIAIDQLVEDYSASGYTITKEETIGNFLADLVARKDEETIVFEIKTSKLTTDRKEQIEKLSDYIKTLGYKFKIIIATPPKEKSIELESIDQMIYEELSEDVPSSLDALSSRTMIEEVYDIDIDKIEVKENGEITIEGDGIVRVELQWGSNDDEATMSDSYPFTFSAILQWDNEGGLYLDELTELDVDTSSFYE